MPEAQSMTCKSVSYTHLDVYKRQEEYAFIIDALSLSGACTETSSWFICVESVAALVTSTLFFVQFAIAKKNSMARIKFDIDGL